MDLDVAAVIFDFDGVLVDSMAWHAEAYRRVFAEAGVDGVADRDVYLQEGQRSLDVILGLVAKRGLGWSRERCEEAAATKQRIFESIQGSALYPDALAVVEEVRRRGVPVGLVTGTDRRNVDILLGDHEAIFDVVVTAADVERGKPDPEPYRKAVETLGVAPHKVITVENAPLGIRSALEAGTFVLAVTTTLAPDDLREADLVVDDLKTLLKLVPEGSA